MNACHRCGRTAHFHDRRTGSFLCPKHARIEVVAARQGSPRDRHHDVTMASDADSEAIISIAVHLWGEATVDCFDRSFEIDGLPALVVRETDCIAALLVFDLLGSDYVVLMLAVLAGAQGRGMAKALLQEVCDRARNAGATRLLIATSNDDLPALALYQQYGFVLESVYPGLLLAHHGGEELGFAGIPVRDEIRLSYELAPGTGGCERDVQSD